MENIVLSVAAYAETDDIRRVVVQSDKVRRETMSACMSVPGYAAAALGAKTVVYDLVKETGIVFEC